MPEDLKYLFNNHVIPPLGQNAPRKITLTPLQLLINKMADDGFHNQQSNTFAHI